MQGTLPFVAGELLAQFEINQPAKHELRHDIESVFWVLLYICLKQHGGTGNRFDKILRGLVSHTIHEVEREKRAVFGQKVYPGDVEAIKGVGGTKFLELERFLIRFVAILRDPTYRQEPMKLGPAVRRLALRQLPMAPKRKPQDPPTPDVSTRARKKPKQPKAPSFGR